MAQAPAPFVANTQLPAAALDAAFALKDDAANWVPVVVSAAGATQGTATVLSSQFNIVTLVAPGTGVIATAGFTKIWNAGANNLLVYPISLAQFDAIGTNLPITIPVGGAAEIVMASGVQGYARLVLAPNAVQGTINATATGTINPTGLRSVVVNVGAVNTTLTVSPGYQGQTLRLEIKQGAAPQAVAFDGSVVFSTDIPSFIATASANARDLMQLICTNGTTWAVAGVNKGFPS